MKMTTSQCTMALACTLAVGLAIAHLAVASDPELTTDFFIPAGQNATTINGTYFTFTGLRNQVPPPAGTFKASKVFADAFPALTGLGISAALVQYQPGAQNPPHTHPRATELLYVIKGTLRVGIVDTGGHYYNQTLQEGDLFVFPKGLVHYQVNPSMSYETTALASFSSSNPGLVSLPSTLFASGIPSPILAQAFKVPLSTIAQLTSPFPH